jgi:hypothetical protein
MEYPDVMDGELVRAWQLIVELSEQNARNQKTALDLKAQASQLQVHQIISTR